MMYKNIFAMLGLALALTACNRQTNNETTMDFTDDVKNALADGGRIDMSRLLWTREPGGFEVKGDTIVITTAPHTD